MSYKTLIDTDTLNAHLNDPAFRVVDCRFELGDPDRGEREYRAGHIPGAVYAHLDRDLSGTTTGTNGRHPLPNPAALTETLGRFGIDDSVQVIAYDQDAGMYASRLWWLLRWLGHDDVAVLDGGWTKWQSEGRAVRSGSESVTARRFSPRLNRDDSVDASQVAQLAHDASWKLVDARAPERYRGEVETIDRAAGHIPGAVNYFFKRNVDHAGVFRSREALRSEIERMMGSVAPDRIVCYCGSGVTACQNILALEHAGLPGAKLYAGSWSEWSSDPSRPIATGEAPAPIGAGERPAEEDGR